MGAILLMAIIGFIGWHLGIDRARERAGREAFSPEASKWASKRFAKITPAIWPGSGA